MDIGDFQLNAVVHSAISDPDGVTERVESPTLLEFKTLNEGGNSNDTTKRPPPSNMLEPAPSSKSQKTEKDHKANSSLKEHSVEGVTQFGDLMTSTEQMDLDYALALSLDQEQADFAMQTASAGKAWDFASKIHTKHQQMLTYNSNFPNMNANNFAPVNVDDMVFLAVRIFEMQAAYASSGAEEDVHVDIGYHYTSSRNMDQIRTDGLLNSAERRANNINANSFNGATFGDGIYTANNPFSYHEFAGGNVGLFVARLKGRTGTGWETNPDTVLGRAGETDEVCVLGLSSQCVALVQFASPMIELCNDNSVANSMVYDYHCELQKIIDDCFNGGTKTTMVQKTVPSQVTLRVSQVPAPVAQATLPVSHGARWFATAAPTVANGAAAPTVANVANGAATAGTAIPLIQAAQWWAARATGAAAPTVIPNGAAATATTGTAAAEPPPVKVIHYTAPVTLSKLDLANQDHLQDVHDLSTLPPDADCSICFRSLHVDGPVAAPVKCAHTFHRSCIEASLGHSTKCPICRQNITGELQGTMPTGTMVIKTNPDFTCSGYQPGTLVITYRFDSGVQKSYHQNPGQTYSSTMRMAYLPDNLEGRKLLKRLKCAFSCGLTFTVGTSLSTGMTNSITWASIHHKNSLSGGVHGFPDAGYFFNANEELDALGVPASDDVSSN